MNETKAIDSGQKQLTRVKASSGNENDRRVKENENKNCVYVHWRAMENERMFVHVYKYV